MLFDVTGTPKDPHRYTTARIRARDAEEAKRIAGCIGLNAIDAKPTQDIETTKVLLQEASEWARHYSNVRMAVTTFLITLSAGILAFKWGDDFMAGMAGVIWIVAGIFFLAFTIPEWFQMSWREKHLHTLTGKGDADREEPPEASWIKRQLVRVRRFLKLAWHFGQRDAGLYALLILSVAFLYGYIKSMEESEDPIEIRIVD